MNRLILRENTELDEALRLLDENGNGTLPVVNEEGVLVGIITDGDIRRGLLNKKSTLRDFINPNPITLPSTTSRKEVIKYLRSINRRQLPLVDEYNKLVEVVVLDDLEFSSKPNTVVIMAGGKGSRLGDLTKEIPKPMLPVGNKPILQNIIENFVDFGFHRFVLCVNYKSHVIKDYFGDGSKFGISIQYTHEDQPMGTAGALSLMSGPLDHPFFVVNGDLLTTVDYADFLYFHTKEDSVASMCIKKFNYQVPYAEVVLDGSTIKGLQEKPTYSYYVNAGIYLLNPEMLDLIPKDVFYNMTDLFDRLIKENKAVKGYAIEDYWLDIGIKEDYQKANKDIMKA